MLWGGTPSGRRREGWSSKTSEQIDRKDRQLPGSPSYRSGAGSRGSALGRGTIPGDGGEMGRRAICRVSLSMRRLDVGADGLHPLIPLQANGFLNWVHWFHNMARLFCQGSRTETNRQTTVQGKKTMVYLNQQSNATVQKSRASKLVCKNNPRAGPVGRRGSIPRGKGV